jgi:hypothetical protein
MKLRQWEAFLVVQRDTQQWMYLDVRVPAVMADQEVVRVVMTEMSRPWRRTGRGKKR